MGRGGGKGRGEGGGKGRGRWLILTLLHSLLHHLRGLCLLHSGNPADDITMMTSPHITMPTQLQTTSLTNRTVQFHKQDRPDQSSLVSLLDQRLCVASKGNLGEAGVGEVSLHEDQPQLMDPNHCIHVVQLVELTNLREGEEGGREGGRGGGGEGREGGRQAGRGNGEGEGRGMVER